VKKRASDLTNSSSLEQIADAPASYLAKRLEHRLPSKQRVMG